MNHNPKPFCGSATQSILILEWSAAKYTSASPRSYNLYWRTRVDACERSQVMMGTPGLLRDFFLSPELSSLISLVIANIGCAPAQDLYASSHIVGFPSEGC